MLKKVDVYVKIVALQLRSRFFSATKQELEKRREELMARGLPKQKPIKGVKHIVLVCSGKGGVGKSTTSVNIAAALKANHPKKGVGLLDTDVFGPSIPLMMNLNETPILNKDNLMEPLTNYGVKCMSMGFLIEKTSAVIWRGLMVMQALEKLLRQVHWSEIDYLVVDTPPGTGDTLLSLVQNLPISGVVLVTTPQTAALEVTRRGASMFNKLKVPIIGIVENMNYVKCSSCSENISIFGKGTSTLANELHCEILGSFPLDPRISCCTEKGMPIVVQDSTSDVSKVYKSVADHMVRFLEE
ncbi:NUBP iron-sulfur cluster assembly factor, mitochondrial isoform X1 [Leptinotarsa decemlineata]|uniref:NUBP iron-sulfur cluster assembly factor, mitochondrial isoform X1 n=2 Tax=Leptinotarsa decemlineata TaxID=7539 RepID=UPI003D306B12